MPNKWACDSFTPSGLFRVFAGSSVSFAVCSCPRGSSGLVYTLCKRAPAGRATGSGALLAVRGCSGQGAELGGGG